MLLAGWKTATVKDLRGAWQRVEQLGLRSNRASYAQNVRFDPGGVTSREGCVSAGFSSGAKVTTVRQWLSQDPSVGAINRLIWFEGTNTVKLRDMIGGGIATVATVTARGIATAEAGTRLYLAFFNTTGAGASQIRVLNPLLSGQPADVAFPSPMSTPPAITDQGSGQMTAGLHYFGYLVESRTGYTGRPAPEIASEFTPASFTVAAGGRRIRVEITATMPSDAAYLHPIVTRKDNPNRWYLVPDAAIAVPAGLPYTAYLFVDISDEDLANRATEITDTHFNYIAPSSNPSSVVALGRRMAYVVYNKLYVSDIDNFQALTEDQHVVQTPGQKQIVTAFQERGVNYILGPAWTHAVVDNDDVPRAWGVPSSVSEALGTTAIFGVSPQTGGGHRFIANEAGLWYFDGRFADLPISYMNQRARDSDNPLPWDRINWSAPYCISVNDYTKEQRVEVVAPLDGATEPTHVLSFGYSRGKTPEAVDFSLDLYGFGGFGAKAIIVNHSTGKSEAFVGPGEAGDFLRHDPEETNDASSPIHAVYETGLVLKKGEGGKSNKFGAIEPQMFGSGNMVVTVKESGDGDEAVLDLILDANPPEDPLDGFEDLIGENCSVRFELNEPGARFSLTDLTVYWKKYLEARAG